MVWSSAPGIAHANQSKWWIDWVSRRGGGGGCIYTCWSCLQRRIAPTHAILHFLARTDVLRLDCSRGREEAEETSEVSRERIKRIGREGSKRGRGGVFEASSFWLWKFEAPHRAETGGTQGGHDVGHNDAMIQIRSNATHG